jgi:membrane protein DedA with SNARE-associated domain
VSAPAQLPGFLETLAPVLDHWGYAAVAFLLFVEDFGVPAPGETVLIAASVYAGAGRLNVVAVGVIGFLAAMLGDNVGFAIGHFGGRALALRWGRYVFLTEERLDKAEAFFNRHGGKIVTVARFIEGLRQANGIIAGITGMRWAKFLLFNALGAALWVGTWTSVGYFAGNHITGIYEAINRYALYLLAAAVVLVVALVVRHRRRRRARLAEGGEGSQGAESAVSAEDASAADAGSGPPAHEQAPTDDSVRKHAAAKPVGPRTFEGSPPKHAVQRPSGAEQKPAETEPGPRP